MKLNAVKLIEDGRRGVQKYVELGENMSIFIKSRGRDVLLLRFRRSSDGGVSKRLLGCARNMDVFINNRDARSVVSCLELISTSVVA